MNEEEREIRKSGRVAVAESISVKPTKQTITKRTQSMVNVQEDAITSIKGDQIESLSGIKGKKGSKTYKTNKESKKKKNIKKEWKRCKHLHKKEGLFIRLLKKEFGKEYAGGTLPVELNYVAITSRLTDKPICKIDVSQSGTGKSYTQDVALKFFPEAAYYKVGSASPTTIVYNDEQYVHRMIVFGEIDSLPEEGPIASALRGLISEGKLVHEVTEQGKSGQFKVRRIEKNGPTGLLTTSTRTPKTQMATRTLVSGIDDSQKQTRAVMDKLAADFEGEVVTSSYEPFIAYQEWLHLAGVRKVIIPFAKALSSEIPERLTRMRRDLTQLFRFIQSITIINQPHREKNEDGALIATVEDYRYARELLSELFRSIAQGGVSPQVRKAVRIVFKEYGQVAMTTHEVAEKMGVENSTASYHCKKAIKAGYIVNDGGRGQPYRMSPGDPLPNKSTILPTTKRLKELIEGNTPVSPKLGLNHSICSETTEKGGGSRSSLETDSITQSTHEKPKHSTTDTPPCIHTDWVDNGDSNDKCGKCGSTWSHEKTAF